MCVCVHVCVFATTVVDCGVLSRPAGGAVDLSSGTTFGSIATYSCNTGYRIDGNITRICLSTGEWSDSEPICQCKSSINEKITR